MNLGDPEKYNKIYFMACSLFWFTHDSCSYDDDDLIDAMDELGIKDKYQKKVLKKFHNTDFIT